MAPNVLAAQTREVGTFVVSGRARRLWVAPTCAGGYCYVFERANGGCRRDRADRSRPLGVSWREFGDVPVPGGITGDVTEGSAARVVVRFADGSASDVPFTWVSPPIRAGFFSYDVPARHRRAATRVVSVDLLAPDGAVLAREPAPGRPAVASQRHAVRHLTQPQPQPRVAPTAPLQHGTAEGVVVVAGANGAVQWDLAGASASRRTVLGRGIDYVCFRLTREFGISTVRALGIEGAFGERAGFVYDGVGTPFDGCELQAEYGHSWPDRFASHSAVEIPFTPKGGAFFADRAAARDLALFLRGRRRRDASRLAPDAPARIVVTKTATGYRFSERSPTGRVFFVALRGRRIAHQNLKPYAFVF
jgi:hypothetical protein